MNVVQSSVYRVETKRVFSGAFVCNHRNVFYFLNLSGKSECEEGLIEEAMHKVCQKTFCEVAKFMKFNLLPHTLLKSYISQ